MHSFRAPRRVVTSAASAALRRGRRGCAETQRSSPNRNRFVTCAKRELARLRAGVTARNDGPDGGQQPPWTRARGGREQNRVPHRSRRATRSRARPISCAGIGTYGQRAMPSTSTPSSPSTASRWAPVSTPCGAVISRRSARSCRCAPAGYAPEARTSSRAPTTPPTSAWRRTGRSSHSRGCTSPRSWWPRRTGSVTTRSACWANRGCWTPTCTSPGANAEAIAAVVPEPADATTCTASSSTSWSWAGTPPRLATRCSRSSAGLPTAAARQWRWPAPSCRCSSRRRSRRSRC